MVNAPSPKTTWGGEGVFGSCIPIPVEIRTGNKDENWNSRHEGILLMAGSPWLTQPVFLHKAGPQPRCGIHHWSREWSADLSTGQSEGHSFFIEVPSSWTVLDPTELTKSNQCSQMKEKKHLCWRGLANHLGGCQAGHPSLLILLHHFLLTRSPSCNLLFSPGFSLFKFSAFFFPSVIYKLLTSLTGLMDVFAFPSGWITIVERVPLVGFPCPDPL